MSAATAFAGRLGLSAWRRRGTWLGLVLLLMGLLVALQLYSEPAARLLSLGSKTTKTAAHNQHSKLNDPDGVRFVSTGSRSAPTAAPPIPPDVDEAIRAELEEEQRAARAYQAGSPSRDEIYARHQQQYPDGDDLEQMGVARVALNPKTPYVPPRRLVHLDLKGAPPKMSWLLQLLPMFKQLGATGLLVEWEDMFPFRGPLAPAAASNHYTELEVTQLLEKSKQLGLDVMPLVQTFGHLEFVLKLEQFSHLRELPDIPQALCPSKNASFKMVSKLIHQVMELHSKVLKPQFVHIGCDEVFTMGECNVCRQKARDDLFVDHVARVAELVRTQYGATPIIWDDMLRHLQPEQLRRLSGLVEPMVWVYAENVYHFVQPAVWDKYAGTFERAWTASAFKGAFGETLTVPNAKRHLENNLRWLEVMTNEQRKFRGGFSGIAVTGWQRYDHFAILCELLPSGLPSLALDLLAVSKGYFNGSLRAQLDSAMSCPASSPRPIVALDRDPYLWERFGPCSFPGAAVFRLTARLESLDKDIEDYMLTVRRRKAWLTTFNVRHNYTTPLRLQELLAEHGRTLHSALGTARQARDALATVFDHHTVEEWIEQRLLPNIERLERVAADADSLRRRLNWPRRPLPSHPALRRLGLLDTSDDQN